MVAADARAGLSVVVISFNSPANLEQCLSAVCEQPVSEVIVVDCSGSDPTALLAPRFPRVRFRHFDHQMSIPQLRSEGLRETTGEIVATIEAWMIPAPDWAAALGDSHRRHLSDPVIGGAVDFPPPDRPTSSFQWADFFSEYGRHIAPGENGYTSELTGANCSYKAWALDACRDLIDRGAWETSLHRRLQQHGHRLRRAARAVVVYHRTPGLSQALRQRFHYGRWFAGERSRTAGWPERLLRAALSPLIPAVLLARLGKVVSRNPTRKSSFAASLPWLLFLYAAWALGEFWGYLFGSGSSEHRIF